MNNPTDHRGFWGTLQRPILALAPMHEVTDAPFRALIARTAKPDVVYTEFVSADGLCSRGKENLIHMLRYSEGERPIVVQLFGKNPDKFLAAAALARELGFDGIDINMGCPVKTIVRNGSCAALIKTPTLAKEIVEAARAGSGGLPVSVKTRIGYNKIIIEEWLGHLLETRPASVTLHLRTAKEMSLVDAHWELMRAAVDQAHRADTLILGNGDVATLEQAIALAEETGADGIMLGRAIFGNPWLFDKSRIGREVSVPERLSAMHEHARTFVEHFGEGKPFLVMRKHLRSYATGFDGARELRLQLDGVNSLNDVDEIISRFRAGHTRIEFDGATQR